MRFLSNPEIKKFLTATVVISLVLCCIAFFYSTATGVFTLGVALFLMVSFLIFTKQRYNRINSLAENIDRILHGNDTLSIQSYGEGELAILECDVQKMLVRLRDQKDKLEKEKTFLSDSIADISHQLRTPLTSIRLLLSLLQSSDLTDARRSALLGELSTLIVKTETLVSMLLKISKIDTGTVQFEMQQNGLAQLLHSAAEPLLIAMDIRNQKLIIDAKDISLCCDRTWCVEAFGNIFKNCIECNSENATITATATDTPIYTQIQITDTGAGFDEDDLPHIFERFYKGKNASNESFGLGLHLSKMIFTAQNATLTAANAPTGGAVFTIRFYKQIV